MKPQTVIFKLLIPSLLSVSVKTKDKKDTNNAKPYRIPNDNKVRPDINILWIIQLKPTRELLTEL